MATGQVVGAGGKKLSLMTVVRGTIAALPRLEFRVSGSVDTGFAFVDRMASVPLVQWSKPALIAGAFGAAFVVASGVFFVETLSQTPPPVRPSIVTETTGRAPPPTIQEPIQEPAAAQPAPAEAEASADCQTQTWPHIARPCLSNEQGSRGVRMITTDKLTEPAISVIEKPPANVIHQMARPSVTLQRPSLFAANAATPPPLTGAALSAIAFAGRFDGVPETEKFRTAAAPAVVSPPQSAAKPEKPEVQKSAVKKQASKQKTKRHVARASDRQKRKPVAVTSRTDSTASNSFSSAPSGFPSGGPFGGLFGSRPNQ